MELQLQQVAIGRQKAIVSEIEIEVSNPTLIVLTGVNGSGKSTLLKTIAGILKPLSGCIFIQEKETQILSFAEIARLLSFVGTERINEDYIRIEDVVHYGQFPYQSQIQTGKENEAVENAIARMGIQSIRSKYLNEVSDGEWQKANIARALAQQTPLIIMDEPSAYLDYPSKRKLFSDLRAICNSENKTILVSTHDLDAVKDYAEIYWHIEDQKLTELKSAPNWNLST